MPPPQKSPSQACFADSSHALDSNGSDDQDAMRVDFKFLAGKNDGGRAELLNHGRAVETERGRQCCALVDRGLAEGAVEIDRPHGLARRSASRAELGHSRPLHEAEAGDAEIDQFDLLFPRIIIAK